MWQSPRDGWERVVLIASGPSLTDEQIAIARDAHDKQRVRVIVVNDNYQRMPDADVLYACDGPWWKKHIASVREIFRGECWTQDHAAATKYGLQWIKSKRSLGLTSTPHIIHLGGNSGHQALNYAVVRNEFKPQTQYLIGFDMKRGPKTAEHPRGKLHWFGNHPAGLNYFEPEGWIRGFNDLARDAQRRGNPRIINCSIDTALTCFARVDLATALGETTSQGTGEK